MKIDMPLKKETKLIYCNEACIKNKSDILCIFTFIYRAVQNRCLLTEVVKKRVNLSFCLWRDVIEEFQ